MATKASIPSNSFGFELSKTSTVSTTCNICARLLYSFEEVLVCRACNGSYHWRCVKPETISHYGENENYICDKCNNGIATHSSHRAPDISIKIKTNDTNTTDYRDFTNISSEKASPKTNVHETIQYFEEKQHQSQVNKPIKTSGLDQYLPAPTNERDYMQHNGQFNNGSIAGRRIQQQKKPNEIESDHANDTKSMFQADYQYTPLKEYAAMKSTLSDSDKNMNVHHNPNSDNEYHERVSRYGGGLRYTNYGFDPTAARLVEAPLTETTDFLSSTINGRPAENRQQHFVTTTNLTISDHDFRRQEQQQQQQASSIVRSAPYLPSIHDEDEFMHKTALTPLQKLEQSSRRSTYSSDLGVATVSSMIHPPEQSDENQLVERKLTNLVQQLGKQLETDAQKINEKLEVKLKELEAMINQQTFVIRRQDEVIERLKSKIQKIETERDHFRDRLYVHEQRNRDEKKVFTKNETNPVSNQHGDTVENNQSNRNQSNTPTTVTDNNKFSTKKTPAPRLQNQWSIKKDENESTLAKFVRTYPPNLQRFESKTSSVLSTQSKVVPSMPVNETPAASSRLDSIIHQPNEKELTHRAPSGYNIAEVRHQERTRVTGPISMEQQVVVVSVHRDDNKDDDDEEEKEKNKATYQIDRNTGQRNASNSPSSSLSEVHTSSSRSLSMEKPKATTTRPSDNLNIHRSFESLQDTYKNVPGPRPLNKTGSLEMRNRPVQYGDPETIYITPVESMQPASQSDAVIKGWLRKQNRDSFLKRTIPFYCVLTQNSLLLHRQEHDRMPQKAITLKGAKVILYNDPKHGASLELTWSSQRSEPKHYHLYVNNAQEANQWLNAIQRVIENVETNDYWRPYRLSK